MHYLDKIGGQSLNQFFLDNGKAEPLRKGSHSRRKPDSNANLMKKKILIVEDEALVAESLREILKGAGYFVVAVLSSGEEAIQAISDSAVDLMIMDVRLSGELTGVEAVRVIHETIKAVPVVFLTAFAEDLYPQISSISHNLYRYVSKPYAQSEIEQAVQELLS